MAADWSGLSGQALAAAVGRDSRPEHYITDYPARWQLVYSYATDVNGMLADWLGPSGSVRPATGTAPAGFCLSKAVPDAWWSDTYPGLRPADDLHNAFPANTAADAARSTYIPGLVTEVSFDNGYMRAGHGMLGSRVTDMWQPPAQYCGDIARIIMYAAVVYPSALWRDRGWYVLDDGQWPGLTAYGRELLLQWHRTDPVDDSERHRDAAIAASQGNHNPFVAHPDLAEYLWGANAGQVYYGGASEPGDTDEPSDPSEPGVSDPSEPSTPDDPALPDEPVALRASYSIATDIWLDLWSPYISREAVWRVDDRAVSEQRLRLDSLGTGRHELYYTTPTASGHLLIHITP